MRRRSSGAGSERTSRPPTRTTPALGSTRRFTILSVVVLPEPEPPTSATSSPRSTRSESSCTASTSP